MTYQMPPLPEGQRWVVTGSMGFVVVKLQEKRRWGWRTIADSLEYQSSGAEGVRRCVDMIARRDEFARNRVRRERERQERLAEIPYGITEGGGR